MVAEDKSTTDIVEETNSTATSDHPVTTVVPDAAVAAVAEAALLATTTATTGDAAVTTTTTALQEQQQQQEPPPEPLPHAWILKESRSQRGNYYYFNYETGVTTWQSPVVLAETTTTATATAADQAAAGHAERQDDEEGEEQPPTLGALMADTNVLGGSATGPSSPPSKQGDSAGTKHGRSGDISDPPASSSKRAKQAVGGNASGSKPSKVRVLHILKKHKDSRRPASWRKAKITITKEQALEEILGLREVLQEEAGEDLRATFEELARTESDCSSAKRGGDLGYFGPKKMQPAFEEASFALKIGELSDPVYTSSGVHVLLRIG